MNRNQDKIVLMILITTIVMVIAQLTKNYWLFAYTMPTIIFCFIFLGSVRKGKMPKVLIAGWSVMFILVMASLLSMLKMVQVPENIAIDLFLGLPKSTAILLFIFWGVTGIGCTGFYAIRFDKDILPDECLEEFIVINRITSNNER